jgi:hypothetical protein
MQGLSRRCFTAKRATAEDHEEQWDNGWLFAEAQILRGAMAGLEMSHIRLGIRVIWS